jgi:GMP synthase (glutamine-hydrolysing)
VPLTKTNAAERDTLLQGLPQPAIMQFHEDTFDIPDEAEQLLAGTACANQAFRVGRATYAFQCHFEATQPIVDHWITVCDGGLRHRFGAKADSVITATRNDNKQKAAAQRSFAEAVTDRWIDLIGV